MNFAASVGVARALTTSNADLILETDNNHEEIVDRFWLGEHGGKGITKGMALVVVGGGCCVAAAGVPGFCSHQRFMSASVSV